MRDQIITMVAPRQPMSDAEYEAVRAHVVRCLAKYDRAHGRKPAPARRTPTTPTRAAPTLRPMTPAEMLTVAKRAADDGQELLARRLLKAARAQRTGEATRETATLWDGVVAAGEGVRRG